MGIKQGLMSAALALGFTGAVHAATVDLGTYSFDTNALVSQVTNFSGGSGMYDGTNFVDPLTSPTTIIDSAGWTFLSSMLDPGNLSDQRFNGLSLDLSFTNTSVVNGADSDVALFFLFDQSANNIEVTINGLTQSLNVSNVFDAGGTQQVANGVDWNGGTLNNVLLMVAELDLNDFNVPAGGVSNSLIVTLNQNVSNPMQVAALSLVGALNTSGDGPSEIPVPAAVWLFGSGLIGLVGIARRRKHC